MTDKNIQKEIAGSLTIHQQLYIKYFTAVLVDLTVLNLFTEYWDYVVIDSFTISLLVALLLQVLLKVTIALEHRIATYIKAKSFRGRKVLRVLSSWAILFLSKLVILEAVNLSFGDSVVFGGPLHGLVVFIVVVIAILVAEQVVSWIYRSLA